MILSKSKLDVNIEQIISDKNGRYILAEVLVEGEKFVFLNIYTPNDQTRQVQFLRGLSISILTKEDSYTRIENSNENSQSY